MCLTRICALCACLLRVLVVDELGQCEFGGGSGFQRRQSAGSCLRSQRRINVGQIRSTVAHHDSLHVERHCTSRTQGERLQLTPHNRAPRRCSLPVHCFDIPLQHTSGSIVSTDALMVLSDISTASASKRAAYCTQHCSAQDKCTARMEFDPRSSGSSISRQDRVTCAITTVEWREIWLKVR